MKKKIVRVSVIILIVLVIAYLGVGYVVYDKLSRVATKAEEMKNTPASYVNNVDEWLSFDVSPYFSADYESVRFPSRQEDLTLAGWYIPGEADAPVIIMTHGLGGCKCSPRILTVASGLIKTFRIL